MNLAKLPETKSTIRFSAELFPPKATATQKKSPTGAEVVIDIANEDDITIGEKKHTLSSLRKLLADSPPREVTVRRKDSTSEGLYNDMNALLRKNGYTRQTSGHLGDSFFSGFSSTIGLRSL